MCLGYAGSGLGRVFTIMSRADAGGSWLGWVLARPRVYSYIYEQGGRGWVDRAVPGAQA